MTEQFKLGVMPPIRESGDIVGTPGLIIRGEAGEVKLEKGVICAKRHIHMSPAEAQELCVNDKQIVQVRVDGERGLTFGNVVVRVHPNFRLAMHIDTDEANAARISGQVFGVIE
jgi:acetate kinase